MVFGLWKLLSNMPRIKVVVCLKSCVIAMRTGRGNYRSCPHHPQYFVIGVRMLETSGLELCKSGRVWFIETCFTPEFTQVSERDGGFR